MTQPRSLIESIWTVTPAIILIAIAFPSFRLLYLLDEVISPTITIKVVGRQWFWSYELECENELCFETDTVTANYDFDAIFAASGNIIGASDDFSNSKDQSVNHANCLLRFSDEEEKKSLNLILTVLMKLRKH